MNLDIKSIVGFEKRDMLERLMLHGSLQINFGQTVFRSTCGLCHRSEFFYERMELGAHPSLLGPGFQEPTPSRGVGPGWRHSLSWEWVLTWTIRSLRRRNLGIYTGKDVDEARSGVSGAFNEGKVWVARALSPARLAASALRLAPSSPYLVIANFLCRALPFPIGHCASQ